MLISLTVKNFKSIRSERVQFGPLTCLLGHNGVGKSNLFDAIHFLSALSTQEIHSAATEVRRTADGTSSPLDLVFARDPDNLIELSADMIVSPEVTDDFGQVIGPSTTLLTYSLGLRFEREFDRLVVEHENLNHIKLGDFSKFTGFGASREFRNSVASGSRRTGSFISTDRAAGRIQLHGDGGSRGRPAPIGKSPRTVVGGTNTYDYPTVLAAKREMESWRILHLEPSAMRSPDSRAAPAHVSASGGHLPATLFALVQKNPDARAEIVNRLRELNSDVQDLDAYSDDVRDQLALRAKLPGIENWLYARSLSDGTLRYIALALMLADVQDQAVLCLEEPENGIHPSRVPNLVELLYDYAVDLTVAVEQDNPLRQVILNSHSPEVARQLDVNDIVFVERALTADEGPISVFRPIARTWRCTGSNKSMTAVPKDRQALADFIGGSPIRTNEIQQLTLEFGTAS